PIVASGPNSAIPHAQTGSRCLKSGDAVVLDFGCVYEGYCSDMTRTVVIGRADNKLKKIYNWVKAAQQLALDGLEAGMTGGAADALARDYFKLHRQAAKFGHSLGHGVGMDVHELPILAKTSTQKLQPGMVFTIEPGLYLSGFGGVRIEDMVVMESDGPNILTTAGKDLIEL
ncbi:MAG TPA: M24 family metallopeptidase, partial [Actinobacteria bacterium]|nr:M24 family metallopeptidase [Actinomycetes bacterium]HEX21523.1 M24 family metallopeptidase [Actinomycetota bacterium]